MVTGRVTPDLYEDILTPIRNSKNLFVALEIDKESKIDIEIAGRQTVKTSKSSYTAAELTGLYNFGEYAQNRRFGGEKSDKNKWNSGSEDSKRAGELLGYEIENADFVAEVNDLLNSKGVEKAKFDDLVSTYSESLTKIDGDKVSKNIVSFSSANPENGAAIIKSTDTIKLDDEEEEMGLATIYVKFPGSKKENVFEKIPIHTSKTAEIGVFAYEINLFKETTGPKVETGTQFKVEVPTTNNRYQVTEYIALSAGKEGLIFSYVENGSLIPSIPGKGVIAPEPPGQVISNITLIPVIRS